MAEEGGVPFDAMRRSAIERLEPVHASDIAVAPFNPYTNHLLGTSGTVTTLAGIALGLPRYDRSRVDGSWHDCDAILKIVERLATLDARARASIACVGRERADLIVPGCAIFSAIHSLWPCEKLRVADRGLREGMLRDLAAKHHNA
jgi:exopolyphosphatase/guanosine-5'-triphosphate,3'-diphosphate pyrophosphatase